MSDNHTEFLLVLLNSSYFHEIGLHILRDGICVMRLGEAIKELFYFVEIILLELFIWSGFDVVGIIGMRLRGIVLGSWAGGCYPKLLSDKLSLFSFYSSLRDGMSALNAVVDTFTK